jgi:hypothetical protein
VRQQARRPWWEKARRFLNTHLGGRLWARKHPGARAPRLAVWTDAIWSASGRCDGRAYYSCWPLSLDVSRAGLDERPWENARWPSVDHLVDPITPNVVIETRLVNDMKTILGEGEFREVVGHLAHVLGVPSKRLSDEWCCTRSFGVPQRPDEPPLEK